MRFFSKNTVFIKKISFKIKNQEFFQIKKYDFLEFLANI